MKRSTRLLYVQARGGLKKQVAAALRTGRARRVPNGDPPSGGDASSTT